MFIGGAVRLFPVRSCVSLVAVCLLAACQAAPSGTPPGASSGAPSGSSFSLSGNGAQLVPGTVVIAATSNSPAIGTLAPRATQPGDCMAFLWLRRSDPALILVLNAGVGEAHMNLDGQDVVFRQTGQSGGIVQQFFEEQTYAASGRPDLKVMLSEGEALEGGVALPVVQVRLTGADGWEQHLAVSGVASCF
jgi:hypothetical protein